MEIMKVRKIGNSKGIVIPQKFLKIVQSDKEEIVIEVDEKGILLKSNDQSPRKGWAKHLKEWQKMGMTLCLCQMYLKTNFLKSGNKTI